MPDAEHAAVAAGFAIRWQRQLLLQGLLSGGVGLVLAVILARLRPESPTFSYWWMWGLTGIWMIIGPALATFLHRRAKRAEALNRQVVVDRGRASL